MISIAQLRDITDVVATKAAGVQSYGGLLQVWEVPPAKQFEILRKVGTGFLRRGPVAPRDSVWATAATDINRV